MLYWQPKKNARVRGCHARIVNFQIFFFYRLLPFSTAKFMGAMDANMVELAERIPVFAEAQVLPRSTANLSELRMCFPSPVLHYSAHYIMR
jgi:hypothetical protein